MQWKLRPLHRQTVLGFEFLDTPGDEIAPRSNEIGKDFQDERLRHGNLLSGCFDSTGDYGPKSKCFAVIQ
jgi:hypothetical protein